MMKKISPVIVVGLALTVLCTWFYINQPPFVQTISLYAYDKFLNLVNDLPQSGEVVVVDIDEKSLDRLGQWPWSRYLIGQMTLMMFQQGADVIAFDILFAEKDRTSPMILKENLNKHFGLDVKMQGIPDDLQDFDLQFAAALESGNTILGCFMQMATNIVSDVDTSADAFYPGVILAKTRSRSMDLSVYKHLIPAKGIDVAIPVLDKVTQTAFFNAVADPDNIVRSNPLVMGLGENRIYPALSLEAVRLHLGVGKCIINYNELGIQNITVGEKVVPTDKNGRIVINYRKVHKKLDSALYNSFPFYSAVDVLTGALPKDALKGKIVFVGTSAVGLHDVKATPLCSDFAGVEVHATMADNILSGDMLIMPEWLVGLHVVVLLVAGTVLTILISRGKSWLSFLIAMAMIMAIVQVSLVFFEKYHFVFVPAWVVVSIFMIYPVLTTIKFWQEEHQKKQVRNMFGTMVSQDVLSYLEDNPGSFSLSGQRAEATMFFSDVANFTTISENLEPDKLTDLLNRYLSPMTNIIMKRNGYVDKYEGDAIMAEWGVPFAMEDHAVQACLAAVEQQRELAELRPWLKKAFGHDIHVRMGINSGVVTAGNMGSDRRFSYTVLGDAVNQAARFEPANKDYKTLIIIGETTYTEAKHAIEARLLDKLVVKGKTKPIIIYELLSEKGNLESAKAEVTALYEEALKLHWDRKWDEAVKQLDRALELDWRDGPSAKIRERILWYKDNPPADSWVGEYVRTTKD